MTDSLILRAARFANKAHEGQKRKWTGLPYIVHPARVAASIQQHPSLIVPDEVVAAAYLHDTMEDCEVTFGEIQKEFGLHVATLVQELTTPKWSGNRKERKEAEHARLARVSDYAKIVKLHDRCDNVLDMDPSSDFTPVYLAESKALLEAIVDENTDRTSVKLLEGAIELVSRKMKTT